MPDDNYIADADLLRVLRRLAKAFPFHTVRTGILRKLRAVYVAKESWFGRSPE